MTKRNHKPRHLLAQKFAQLKFMIRIGVRMKQTNRNRFGLHCMQVMHKPVYVGGVQGLQFYATGIHPTCNRQSPRSRHQKVRFQQIDGILAVTPFVGNFENVTKARGCNRGHSRTATLDQCIGCKRCAVNHSGDLIPRLACFLQHIPPAFKGSESRMFCLRGRFRRSQYVGVLIHQNRVCERAANVDCKTQSACFGHKISEM